MFLVSCNFANFLTRCVELYQKFLIGGFTADHFESVCMQCGESINEHMVNGHDLTTNEHFDDAILTM